VVTLVLAAVASLGAYAAWLYVVHPPPETRAAVASPAPAASASAAAARRLEPAERESYALQIGAAQERLGKGEANNAVTLFREAFANGGTSVARSLLAHAEAAFESPDGKCKLSGLGRPRPFELGSPASRPTLVQTQAGSVTAWVDNHVDSSRRQAFSVLLDPALRRATPPRLVTPEAESVRHPQLISTGDRIAFIYWDGAGEEPGVYVRMLDPDGRIAGPTRRISAVRRHEFNPALTRAEDGSFWAVWEEELGGGATDLMGRHLGAALEPLSDAVRLTALVPRRGVVTSASKADIAISRGRLHVIFTQERGQRQQIMLLNVALSDAALASGLGLDDIGPNAKRRPTQDRYVGTAVSIGTPYGKSAQPRLACSTTGCFAVWDDEKRGAFAAFIDPESGQALWHREFASKGQRPALAATATEVVVAYYDNLRVKLARLDRDGIGPPSSVARVSGYQPYPAIVAGPEPGQWYISWRDYEAGHYEAFVARAQCQT
jgi:serine/threonine-protein kinase